MRQEPQVQWVPRREPGNQSTSVRGSGVFSADVTRFGISSPVEIHGKDSRPPLGGQRFRIRVVGRYHEEMRLLPVHQQLVSNPLADIAACVREQLDALRLDVPNGDVAITVGSRGIANIPLIVKTAGEWLRERGAQPFIVPSMGSHNGATAEGQQEMVESLGMSEAAMGMPIRSSMDCVKVGAVDSGDVWMDRYSAESMGVLVINRVKLHTCFAGPLQSGLVKMMVVGLGRDPVGSDLSFRSHRSDGNHAARDGKVLGGLGQDHGWAGHPGRWIRSNRPDPRYPWERESSIVSQNCSRNIARIFLGCRSTT